MKKWIAALLAIVLLLGVLPAALAVETKAVTFQVGFGQADVTPILNDTDMDGNTNSDPNNKDSSGNAYPIYYMAKRNGEKTNNSIHIAGSFNTETRLARGVASEDEHLYMKAVALFDGTNTQVVMTSDFIRVPIHWNEYVEAEVLARLSEEEKQKYCLTEDFVSMSATHTHSSVDIGDIYETTSDSGTQPSKWHTSTAAPANGKETVYYTEYWLPGAVDAVLAALEDLTPATIRAGTQDFGGSAKMNWVRHWSYSDGTMSGVNFESMGGTAVAHTREADPEMQLIHFVRAGGKDIVLVNYQAHPTGCMGQKNRYLSSEYCGVLCSYLEKNYTDAEGLSPHAAYFQGAAGNIMYWPSITSEQTGKIYNYVSYGNTLGEMALSVLQSDKMITRDAGAVKFMRNEHTAVERGYRTTRLIQQDTVAVGGAIAFVTAGYEMFDSTGMFVKNNSPYDVTFVIENAQGHEYMPDWQACHYTLLGGPNAYENWASCHNMVPGTAEDLADCLVSMLNILYES